MFKCKICGKSFTEIQGLYNHIDHKHREMIPKDMSVEQYYYFMKTGRVNGNCVMCKQPTSWNKNTGKYNRFCDNPSCKEKYREEFRKRMIGKYGKTHLLNDPVKQREMLANRKISGTYDFNGVDITYTGSYELDFLKTMDGFFDWDPNDIMMPSPHTYSYKYNEEEKFYIPDVFIPSLNLEIEIKDGGDNPNMHHKIQDVDKVKEKAKDEVMVTQKSFHYIKITNKNYTNLFDFLKEVKKGFEKYGDENKIPRIFKIEDIKTKSTPIKESTEEMLEETIYLDPDVLMMELKEKVNEFENMRPRDFAKNTTKLIEKAHNKENINHLKDYTLALIKRCKSKDDIIYIESVLNDIKRKLRDDYQKGKLDKTIMSEFNGWVDGRYAKAIKKRKHKLHLESTIIEESSISYPKLNEVIQADTDRRLKEYLQTYTDYYEKMMKERPDACHHINDDVNRAIDYINDLKHSNKVNKKLADEAIRTFKHIGDKKKHICESVKLYLVFDPNKKRQVFSLNDTESMIFVEENFCIERKNVCCESHIKSFNENKNGKRVIEMEVITNETFDIGNVTNNIIKINSLYKLSGNNDLFFKELCEGLNIKGDVNIKSDKIYDMEGCEIDGGNQTK